jgi:phage shock protein A
MAKYFIDAVNIALRHGNVPFARAFAEFIVDAEEAVTRWESIVDLHTSCIDKLDERIKILEKSILERQAKKDSAGQDSEIDTKSQL